MSKYQEITELYEYCKKNGIDCTIEPLYDGYAIRFPSGGDFVQHSYSYGSCVGYVEPAIGFGCRHDFHAVSLRNAKEIVKRYKDRLNARKGKTVEPAIGFGCRHDFHAVSLRNAKEIVKRYKDRLNARKGKTVEPAIGFGCRHDFHAVSLRNAKEIVKRYKDRLNARKGKT